MSVKATHLVGMVMGIRPPHVASQAQEQDLLVAQVDAGTASLESPQAAG